MSPVYLRDLGFQRNKPEDREGLARTRRPGRGHLGHSEVQPGILLGINWIKLPEDLSQIDRLQGTYGNHQRLVSYQAVQTPGGKGNQDKGESSHYQSYRRTAYPDRAYSDSFRLTGIRPNQLSSGFTPFTNQKRRGQE
ncbi:hypothetical protein O181_084326 [Austropuccinia psidii MF-1]|uniref:Uncharacterized protein n=1 Tax=Austropuccinia psidii MF-1 TaxID=1389203 RepID=A0A9Q3FWC0_9BASI|nr:hypothetical protein [Austropuccinia psidii MF-1]